MIFVWKPAKLIIILILKVVPTVPLNCWFTSEVLFRPCHILAAFYLPVPGL